MSKYTHQEKICCHRRIGELLVDGGFISADSLETALQAQKSEGRPLGEVLLKSGILSQQEQTAVLALQRQLDEGSLSPSDQGWSGLRLGDLLLKYGDITEEQLRQALSTQSESGGRLGDVLIAIGAVKKESLDLVLRLQRRLMAAAATALFTIGAVHPAHGGGLANDSFASRDALKAEASESITRFVRYQARSALRQIMEQGTHELPEELGLRSAQKQRLSEYSGFILESAMQFGIPAHLIVAVMHTESSFNPLAESRRQAFGLMQVVASAAGTAANGVLTGRRFKPTSQELFDPETNIRIGSAYLALLETRYFDNVDNDDVRELAVIAAYNWGPARVRRMFRRYGIPDNQQAMRDLIEQSAPEETRHYVARVCQRRDAYQTWLQPRLPVAVTRYGQHSASPDAV